MEPRRADMAQKEHALERGPARRALLAIVDTLLDGAPPELAVQMRAELPDVLKGATKAYNREAPASPEEFVERFRERAGMPSEDATHEARIAIAVIGQMLLGQTFRDLKGSFPPDFAWLFEHDTGHEQRHPDFGAR